MTEGGQAQPWAGQEVLVVDQDARVRRGLERLLTDVGLQVTAVADDVRARDQLLNKFFAVALIDLDTPSPDAGLDIVRYARTKAPLSAVVALTGRKTFDSAAAAFRVGAIDVVPKTQDMVAYLRDRVTALASNIKAGFDREQLLDEAAQIHEDFLTEMMALSRRFTDQEDRLMAREGGSSATIDALSKVNVLLVDDDGGLPVFLDRVLVPEKGWHIRYVQTGGEALDAATQTVPHVLVVKDALPDLPATMVIKTIRSSAPDAVALVFSPPSGGAVGEVKMLEQSRLITIVPSFTDPMQLATALEEVRQGLKQKGRERRYMNNFRKEHFEFLKRYSRLKEKIAAKRGRAT